MERLVFRSTTLLQLQAELRQRELLAEAERPPTVRRRRRLADLFSLPIGGRRPAR